MRTALCQICAPKLNQKFYKRESAESTETLWIISTLPGHLQLCCLDHQNFTWIISTLPGHLQLCHLDNFTWIISWRTMMHFSSFWRTDIQLITPRIKNSVWGGKHRNISKQEMVSCITPKSLQTSKDPEGGNMCHVLSQIKKESWKPAMTITLKVRQLFSFNIYYIEIRLSCYEPIHYIGGHFGRDKTFSNIAERFYWKMMWKDVDEYVRTCPTCQMTNDANFQKAPAALHPIPVKSKCGTRYITIS